MTLVARSCRPRTERDRVAGKYVRRQLHHLPAGIGRCDEKAALPRPLRRRRVSEPASVPRPAGAVKGRPVSNRALFSRLHAVKRKLSLPRTVDFYEGNVGSVRRRNRRLHMLGYRRYGSAVQPGLVQPAVPADVKYGVVRPHHASRARGARSTRPRQLPGFSPSRCPGSRLTGFRLPDD